MHRLNKSVSRSAGSGEMDEPIFHIPPGWLYEDPEQLEQQSLINLSRLNIPELWKIAGTQGEGIKIAVLDTGATHTRLRISGYANFTDGLDKDEADHGTRVAGIIAAQPLETSRRVGVAPGAKLYVAKVIKNATGGEVGALYKGINWALQMGVDIINISMGTGQDMATIHNKIMEAKDQKIYVICAAGNGGKVEGVTFPAYYEECLAVGAHNTQRNGRWEVNSNLGSAIGSALDIMALGEAVPTISPPAGESVGRGTSVAAPFITGVLALALAKVRRTGSIPPNEIFSQLRAHLQNTAYNLPLNEDPPLKPDREFGYGRVEAEAFLKAI